MFKNEKRYVTRGVNEIVDLRLQLLMWNYIDELKDERQVDYLQIFRISKEDDKNVIIVHEQEEPRKYKAKYLIELEDIEIIASTLRCANTFEV